VGSPSFRLASAYALLLGACGASSPPSTVPRNASGDEQRALRSALAAIHGDAFREIATCVAGRTSAPFVVYEHRDAVLADAAVARACGGAPASLPAAPREGCATLAIARLVDGTLERYELGWRCDEGEPYATLETADFDGDGRDELSAVVSNDAFVVVDTETFAGEPAGGSGDYEVEHPEGTGLYATCWHAGPIEHPIQIGPEQESYDFEDDPGADPTTIRPVDCEPVRADCEIFRFRYDPARDCWPVPAR